jgi:hypothetical protein
MTRPVLFTCFEDLVADKSLGINKESGLDNVALFILLFIVLFVKRGSLMSFQSGKRILLLAARRVLFPERNQRLLKKKYAYFSINAYKLCCNALPDWRTSVLESLSAVSRLFSSICSND